MRAAGGAVLAFLQETAEARTVAARPVASAAQQGACATAPPVGKALCSLMLSFSTALAAAGCLRCAKRPLPQEHAHHKHLVHDDVAQPGALAAMWRGRMLIGEHMKEGVI